ncbi:MAG: DNA-directed RNA polymerase subunit beta' [bacterium]|nr:DNA-directed RNA polymerase subunit beta' [bacterium]
MKAKSKHIDNFRLIDFKGLKLSLASPDIILDWSYGEVKKAETINYRTLKPEKDGLFCERIFGPTKDYECYCGKYRHYRNKGVVCDRCGVEVTSRKVRRERMGHITLAAPVAHIWFFKTTHSHLALLLDVSAKALESVIYLAAYLVLSIDEEKRKHNLNSIKDKIKHLRLKIEDNYNLQLDALKKKKSQEIAQIKTKIKNQEQQQIVIQEIKHKYQKKTIALENLKKEDIANLKELHRNLVNLLNSIQPLSILNEVEYLKLQEYEVTDFLTVATGAEAILKVLDRTDWLKEIKEINQKMAKKRGSVRMRLMRRQRLIKKLLDVNIKPSWMILTVLPVLPPDLRPMVQLSGGRFASSDLNDLYRRVINRNNRLKHLLDLGAPEIILRNEKRMLQQAVDALIDATKNQRTILRRGRQPLRSLSDMLRGKQGRFRQNLLGKRVDYSGRSVIVVGPELNLNQCGLPKEMALEMFKPFVLHELIARGIAPNLKSAKNLLEHRIPEVYDILEDVTKNHLVLLNRAPTLHKLSIQAFYPVLVEGLAIKLHPCVCAGFNADFDGDQMAVHVPLSKESIKESINLMLPQYNLLKPAEAAPITLPNKEMALGTYFLTYIDPNLPKYEQSIFADDDEAILAYRLGQIKLRQLIKVNIDGEVVETSVGRLIFNQNLPESLRYINKAVGADQIKEIVSKAIDILSAEETRLLIDNLKELGFYGATISGISVSISDSVTHPDKQKIIEAANQQVIEIEQSYNEGLITYEEKQRLANQVWMEVTKKLADMTWALYTPDNPVRVSIESGGSRATKDQVKQISAMRGLIVDPMGNIVELPTKSNFREGLSVFEYVTSVRGARKGLTDSALKTADAGYLTRRLVDTAHDMIIRTPDCGTDDFIDMTRQPRAKTFAQRLFSRTLAQDIKVGRKVIAKKGQILTWDQAVAIASQKQITKVPVFSPLTCKQPYGVCQKCYGFDLSNKQPVDIGAPIGVVAAQSIGEPGTQLTMRVRHTGGVVGIDVTQGLPRVEELFEVRKPKVTGVMASIDGKVVIKKLKSKVIVTIKPLSKNVEEEVFEFDERISILVDNGQVVVKGTPLTQGSLNVREVLKLQGRLAAQRYLLDEIQAVYESQGIGIHDKHFEVIIRKMFDMVQIKDPGDSSFLPGEVALRYRVDKINAKLKKLKKQPIISYEDIVLGITRIALKTESWLSAASFQETTNVLANAALQESADYLVGLKENVIIGRLIPVTPDRVQVPEEVLEKE